MGIISPNIDEMKRLVREKAEQLLDEFTEDNLDYFIKEASVVAERVLERYIFAVYDFYTIGEFSIIDPASKEAFMNYKTGYQQKMLDWKNQNKPEINTTNKGKYWHLVTLGVGTAGAIGLAIYCYWKGLTVDRCCLVGIAVELLTLLISYYLYLKEKKVKKKHEKHLEQYETELIKKKDDLANEVIDQLENWLKQGENYSNELLTTYNK